MSRLTVELGKTYKTLKGNTITITSEIKEGTGYYDMGYRFVGGLCGQYYTARGKCYVDDDGENPGDLVEEVNLTKPQVAENTARYYPGRVTDRRETWQRNVVWGKNVPDAEYTTITDGMCLVMLGGLSGEVISQLDVDQNCSVLAKHAISAIKAAFDHGKTVGRSEARSNV